MSARNISDSNENYKRYNSQDFANISRNIKFCKIHNHRYRYVCSCMNYSMLLVCVITDAAMVLS